MKKILASVLLSVVAYSEATCSVVESGNEYVINVSKAGLKNVVVRTAIPEKFDTFKSRLVWGKGYPSHEVNSSFVGDVRFVEVNDNENLTLEAPRKIYAKTDANGVLSASVPANWRFRIQADGGDSGWHIHYGILKMNGYGSQYRWVGECDDRQIVTGDGNKTGWMRVHYDDFNLSDGNESK